MINNARINSGHIAQQCDDFRRIQVEVIAIADRKFEGGKYGVNSLMLRRVSADSPNKV